MKRASLAFGILLSSVVLVDCGSKMLGSDDVGSQSGAVVTADNAIVAAKIVGTNTPGETAGEFSVTDGGQASYTIPLWTPDGPMGVGPSLAIEYDSSGGPGSLGVGFSLTGNVISAIARCRKTIALDGEVGPIEVGGTTYCLDGKRLVPLSASSNEYRTQEDDGSKILRSGTDPTKPDGWTVYLRNGQILTYGMDATGVSRLAGTLKPTFCPLGDPQCDQAFSPATGSTTLAWALEKMTDRVANIAGAVSNGIGNYMTIKYTTFASANTPKYGTDFNFKEMLVSQIDYGFGSANGAASKRQVVFTYDPTRMRDDARYTFTSGVPLMSTRLLQKIDMYGPNPTTKQLLKTYRFFYDSVIGVSGRSRLSAIQECDGASPTPTCKKGTQFQWDGGGLSFRDIVDPNWRSIDPSAQLTVLDFNGDGKSDVVMRTVAGTAQSSVFRFYTSQMGPELALPGSTAPTAPVRQESYEPWSHWGYQIGSLVGVDIDHDGRSDLAIVTKLGAQPGTSQRLDLWRNIGNQTSYQEDSATLIYYDTGAQTFTEPFYPDLDGDGLPDNVQLGEVKVRNPLNQQLDYSRLVVRQNNVGAVGGTVGILGPRKWLQVGSTIYTSQSNTSWVDLGNGYRTPFTNYPSYLVDIDGSGRTAFLTQDSYGVADPGQDFDLNVTAGSGVDQLRAFHLTRAGDIKTVLPALGVTRRGAGNYRYLWLDLNGDGMADALEVPNDNTNLQAAAKASDEVTGITKLRVNTGAGFKRYIGAAADGAFGSRTSVNARPDAGVLVGDMNQDGIDDVVLTAKAARGTVVDRDKMQLLVGTTGTTATSHLVAYPTALKTSDGVDIPTVDPFVFPDNSVEPPLMNDMAVPAALGDFNGDGLLDIAVVRGGQLHFYIHQGNKADLLKSIDTGTGRHVEIKYKPTADSTVYRRMREGQPSPWGSTGTWEPPAECKHPSSCLSTGKWVVARYDVTNDQKVNVGHHMFYSEGHTFRNDKWLGFAERWDYDEVNGAVSVTTYDNRTPGPAERYPFAFLPSQEIRIVRDNGSTPGTNDPHRFITTNHYQEVPNVFTPLSYTSRLLDSGEVEEILTGTAPSLPVENLVFDNTASKDVLGNATTYFTYDSFDNLKTEQRVNADGWSFLKTYNPVNNPSTWIMNTITSMSETSTNQISGESATRTRAFTYYGNTLLLNTETIQGGGGNDVRSVITYTRGAGALGQITQETTTATSTADDKSVPTGTTLTRTQTTTYDAVDGVTVASVTNAMNRKTLYAYHGGLGVLAQTEDPNGVITTNKYDTFGRLRKTSVPTSGDLTVEHVTIPTFPSAISSIVSGLSPVYAVQSIQVGGEDTIVTYNANGSELVRQTKAGDGAYRYKLTRYNATPGQVGKVSLPLASTDTVLREESYLYDRLGRKIQITHPDTSKQTWFYTPRFGPLGFVKTTLDELNHKREEAHNGDGRIVAVTEYLGGGSTTTSFVYGPFGLLMTIGPPAVTSAGGTKGVGISITYDALGRRLQYTEGDSGAKLRAYNAFGDVVAEKDPTGVEPNTFYKRDSLGRITERSNTRDGVNTYVWDTAPRGTTAGAVAIGKIASTTSFDGTTTSNVYDTYARPTETTWNVQGRSYKVKRAYILTTGQVGQIDYPVTNGTQQLKVTYVYDSAGNISSVKQTSGSVTYWKATRWASDGQIDQENDATGMVTTRVYDPNRRWTSSIATAAAGTTLQNVAYGHDVAGNVTSRTDTDPGVNTSESFTYDEVNKLKKWTFTAGSSTWTTDYAAGTNAVLQQASGVIQQTKTGPSGTSLTYDYFGSASSQLPHAARKINTKTLNYDGRGRQTLTFRDSAITYTAFDLPKTITNAAGTTTLATYKYDADNHRVHKVVGSTNVASIADIYERRSGGSSAQHVMYVRGPNGRVVAQETWTDSGTTVTASPILYLHDDILGSTAVTNTAASGTGATRLRYEPYGLRISPTNPTQAPFPAPPTRIGFTGHDMDDEFDYINMKGRIYDATTARFLTPDPVVSAPYSGNGYDRYGYALNNPLRNTDPTGFMVPIADTMFIAMGYDQDHINMMREFNEVSIVRSGERWEAERQRRQTALEREVNRPMEAIFNAAADVRNRTVAAGKEYGTIVYAVNRDGHTIYGHTALVTDDLANKVDTDSAEQFLPDGATPIALVHGHPDANFEQGGQTWHTKPEEWSPGDEVALAQRQARYGDLPRETGRPASMLSAIVVTAGGDVKWFRDKETGHHTIGRAR